MEHPGLVAALEAHRPRLLAVATRALGSLADAEDAVQEAWIRLNRHGGEGIDNLGGWPVRILGRIFIDMLRSRTARAESTFDPWGADPVGDRGRRAPKRPRCSPTHPGSPWSSCSSR